MFGLKDFFQKKQDKALEKQSLKEVIIAKIQQFLARIGKKRMIIIGTAISLLIIVGWIVFGRKTSYTDYTVTSIAARVDTSATKYVPFKGKILKYSLDGVSYVDSNNKAIWNHTYSIQKPIIDVVEDAIVIAEQRGNHIYIFNEKGLIGSINTTRPILKVKVSNQGNVLAVLEDGEKILINLYDVKGEEIAKSSQTLEQAGYPMDIALSPDSKKTMVSFLTVNNDEVSSNIAFYNYGSVRSSQGSNLVNSINYKNAIIPQTKYINNNIAVAVRDNGFSIYKGAQIPDEIANITFTTEIQSVYYSKTNVGFIFRNADSEEKYKMVIYDLTGKLIFEENFNLEYTRIELDEKQVIIMGEKECSIYSLKEKLLYTGVFEQTLIGIFGQDKIGKYTVITTNAVMNIKLK
jgi:hypothetical protein